MSDRMIPMPFGQLMDWALGQYAREGTLFGVAPYVHEGGKTLPLFGETIETPFGPAAGPHTQLCQNLVAAYAGGGRFFELKTVQTLDGEDLPVSKPCILAGDECYNVEWSTELYVPQALDEYIKGWWALKLISAELGLGDPRGFVFNMSVGYDLKGIQSDKIDRFIEGLKDARHTPIWRTCEQWALDNLPRFSRIDAAYVKGVEPRVCRSITLSTLHGCPPEEIERIASYLIGVKGLNTYIKCNPTLLGYDFARKALDGLGFGYVSFDTHHFDNDLQYKDALPMLERLLNLARAHGVEFGVKLTNTFPVKIEEGELPGQEMYMSGRSLYPLSINLARRLEHSFGGQLRVSYSGGADAYNIGHIFDCGIWPITMATTLLKPGGYQRMTDMARALSAMPYAPFAGVDVDKLDSLADGALTDPMGKKPLKPVPVPQVDQGAPLIDCFMAPCQSGCPIGQDIPQYLHLAAQGKYLEALDVICEKNPLPFITGTICSHRCMLGCTRNFYDQSVDIRGVKLEAARRGMADYIKRLAPGAPTGHRVAVVGGGPAGMAAAFLLARGGAQVTLFEKRPCLGGVVRYVIPAFRIAGQAIDGDAALLTQLGVDIRLNCQVDDVHALLDEGYTHAVLAVGAWAPGQLKLQKGQAMNALAFLERAKADGEHFAPGRVVAVVGGGNTAMDAARAATRLPGVEAVNLVYRRTTAQMPADGDELELAVQDGVEFMDLLAPLSHEGGTLICQKMTLGQRDHSGRRSPVPTGEWEKVPADLVVAAVGERVDGAFLQANGVAVDDKGRARQLDNGRVFVIGDGLRGPATVVECIADATRAAQAILSVQPKDTAYGADADALRARHGHLLRRGEGVEGDRCLGCPAVCENCVEVCPNRANVRIHVPGMDMPQVVHVDDMCNECGNCQVFCPYSGGPYKEKWTLFSSPEGFAGSDNQGFLPLGGGRVKVRLGGQVYEEDLAAPRSPKPLVDFMNAVIQDYAYLA